MCVRAGVAPAAAAARRVGALFLSTHLCTAAARPQSDGLSRSAEPSALMSPGATAATPAPVREPAAARACGLLPLLLRRLADDKSGVRKAALAALEAIAMMPCANPRGVDPEAAAAAHDAAAPAYESWDAAMAAAAEAVAAAGAGARPRPTVSVGEVALTAMAERCADVGVAIRKSAIDTMSAVYAAEPSSEALQGLWLAAILPLAMDAEGTVQARAAEQVTAHITDRVIAWHKAGSSSGGGGGRRRRPARGGESGESDEEDEGSDEEGDGGGRARRRGAVAPAATRDTTVWQLLSMLAGRAELVACLRKAVSLALKAGGLNLRQLLPALQAAAGAAGAAAAAAAEEDAGAQHCGAWLLLDAVVGQAGDTGSVDVEFVVECWEAQLGALEAAAEEAAAAADSTGAPAAADDDSVRVLRVLCSVAHRIPAPVASALATDLLGRLKRFTWSPALVAPAILLLSHMCILKSGTREEAARITCQWVNDLLDAVEPGLRAFVMQQGPGGGGGDDAVPAPAAVVNRLFIIGAVAVLGLDDDKDVAGGGGGAGAEGAAAGGGGGEGQECGGASSGRALTAGIRVPIPGRIVTLVQALLAPTLSVLPGGGGGAHSIGATLVSMSDGTTLGGADTTVGSIAGGGGGGAPVPPEVRAHAFVTFGKLCLRDGSLGKKFVTVLVRELSCTANPVVVRNNVLVVLGDLCIRYTALVDRHLPDMAACMRDESPLVRRHAIMLLTQLLLQDFVKWRASLFFRFAAALVDGDPEIRALATSSLTHVLLGKFPGIFASNFVETVFVLQGCTAHPEYNKVVTACAGDSVALSIPGPENHRCVRVCPLRVR
jgi:hypothetical protein